MAFALGSILLIGGAWFGWQGANGKTTALHHFLTLNPPTEAGKFSEHGKMFADTAALKAAMDTALKEHPDKPVVLDFMPTGAFPAKKWRFTRSIGRKCIRQSIWNAFSRST